MHITETLNEGLKREIKITVGADDLSSRLSERLDTLSKQVRIKGFRPGKVPPQHLRKVYGKNVMAEIIQETVDESSRKAVEERGERPAFQPTVTFSENEDEIAQVMDGKADLAFTMAFEVMPDLPKPDYKAITLEKHVAEVSDEMVDEGVERIGSANRTYTPRKAGAKAKDGDKVTLDYLGKLDGEPFDGGAEEGAQLVLGSNTFIPGFEEQVIGMKAGDSADITVTFPEAYQAAHLAGKEAVFSITVHEVAEPAELKLDDEFAKSLGVESLETLREAIRGQIQTEHDNQSRNKLKRQLLDALDEQVKADLPEVLVTNEFDALWQQVTGNMEATGRTWEAEETTEEKAREDYQKIAERRVRLGLLLADIGNEAGIEVTEEELNRAIVDRVRQFPGQEQQIIDYIRKTPSAVNEIRAPIFEDKVVNYALELCTVEEKTVSRDDLFADDEDDEAAA